VDGDLVIKCLCEVLSGLGLKINSNKTNSSQNVIRQAIKEDKWFWLCQTRFHGNLQKHLLIIHDLADRYPNSGSLSSALAEYNKRIIKRKKIKSTEVIFLISIIADIACNNPKVYPESAAILSKLISFSCEKIDTKKDKLNIFNKIKLRLDKIPNSGHLQLWLQRITLNIDPQYEYDEDLCKLVSNESVKIWNFEWLNKNFRDMLDVRKIIDYDLIKSLPDVIEQDEVDLFGSLRIFY